MKSFLCYWIFPISSLMQTPKFSTRLVYKNIIIKISLFCVLWNIIIVKRSNIKWPSSSNTLQKAYSAIFIAEIIQLYWDLHIKIYFNIERNENMRNHSIKAISYNAIQLQKRACDDSFEAWNIYLFVRCTQYYSERCKGSILPLTIIMDYSKVLVTLH